MSLYSSLQDSLHSTLSTFLPSTTVIHSHGGGQEPSGKYLSINILNINRVGREYDSTYTNDIEPVSQSTSVHEATVRLLFIGNGSGDDAYDLEALLHNNATRFVLYQNNLAVMRLGDVTRVPEKRDTTWVDYFKFDVIFSYAVVNEQPVEIIEDVSWNNNVYG